MATWCLLFNDKLKGHVHEESTSNFTWMFGLYQYATFLLLVNIIIFIPSLELGVILEKIPYLSAVS